MADVTGDEFARIAKDGFKPPKIGHTNYWSSGGLDFILRDGQLGIEIDSAGAIVRSRLGDGSTDWDNLDDWTVAE